MFLVYHKPSYYDAIFVISISNFVDQWSLLSRLQRHVTEKLWQKVSEIWHHSHQYKKKIWKLLKMILNHVIIVSSRISVCFSEFVKMNHLVIYSRKEIFRPIDALYAVAAVCAIPTAWNIATAARILSISKKKNKSYHKVSTVHRRKKLVT